MMATIHPKPIFLSVGGGGSDQGIGVTPPTQIT